MGANQVKSLVAAGFLIFLMLVVFGGDIYYRWHYGIRFRGVSYCHNVEGVPVLGDMPCFVVNFFASVGVFVLFLAIVLIAIAGARKLRD